MRKKARTKFWRAIFGIEAPFHPTANQYDEDRERYNELLVKKKNGTLVVDEEAEPPIDEEEDFDTLDSLFDRVNENIYPNQVPIKRKMTISMLRQTLSVRKKQKTAKRKVTEKLDEN